MRNAIILGSGRSGTSMLAGLFANAGYFVGDDPYPGRESNPKGFFETKAVNGINEGLIAGAMPRDLELGAWQRWLATMPVGTQFVSTPEVRARMQRLTARQPFCFKDPRFSYTLPAWREALGDARYLCVFRHPAATAKSIVHECSQADYLKDVTMDFERALEIWVCMYRHILDVHRHVGEWMFLHFDQVLTPEGQDRIEAFVEAPLARDFPEARLQHAHAEAPVTREAAEIYRELCRLAGFTAPEVAVRRERARPVEIAASSNEPALSVILCTDGGRATLFDAIASWEAQDAPPGSFELIVVDRGSTDATQAELARRAFTIPARGLRCKDVGPGIARNAGIAAANGRILLFVDDGTLARPDLVTQHLECHRAHAGEEISVVGALEPAPSALDNALTRLLEGSAANARKSGDWNHYRTCNASTPREAILAVGGFDEEFDRSGCQDADLALRLEALGYRVHLHAAARAQRGCSLDLEALEERQRSAAQSRVHLIAKHPRVMEHRQWAWVKALTLRECERIADERRPELERLTAAASQLAAIDLRPFESKGHCAATSGAAADILARLAKLVSELDGLWTHQGFAAGLSELGVETFLQLQRPRPWPLATDAPIKLLACPDYASDDLGHVMREFARHMVGRDDVCLVLRHDAGADGPLVDAQRAVEVAYASCFSSNESLNVLFFDDRLDERDRARLNLTFDAALVLPGSSDSRHTTLLRGTTLPLLESGEALAAHLLAPTAD